MQNFTAVIERDADTGLYVGWVPGFPGADSQGQTLDELRANLQEVIDTVSFGEAIESYPNDKPYPSTLSLAMVSRMATPLHVLWAMDPTTRKIIIITTYVPDDRWHADFRTRKEPR